jgi:hypothetical protein
LSPHPRGVVSPTRVIARSTEDNTIRKKFCVAFIKPVTRQYRASVPVITPKAPAKFECAFYNNGTFEISL